MPRVTTTEENGVLSTGEGAGTTFGFEITTSGDAETVSFILDITAPDEIIVYWGDGTNTTYDADGTCSHEYATTDSFEILITGACVGIKWYGGTPLVVTEILGFGSNLTITSGADMLRGCTNLIGSIPPLTAQTGLTTMESIFRDCAGLTNNFPALSSLTSVTDMQYAFYNNSGITGSLPTLPAGATLVTVSGLFSGCTGVTGNTPNISGLTGVLNAYRMFFNCNNLNGSIGALPVNLTHASEMFKDCNNILGPLPSWPTGMVNMSSMFMDCYSITGSIPTMSSFTVLTTMSQTFFGCSALAGTYPTMPATWATDADQPLEDVSLCYFNCYALTGTAPAMWDWTDVPNSYGTCYYENTSADNWATIQSEGWNI